MPGSNLQAHNRRETPIAHLGLDQLEQVVCFFFISLGVGVACYAEQVTRRDAQAWEEHVQGVGHHLFESHVVRLSARNAKKSRNTLTNRNLHSRHHRLRAVA